MAKPELGTKRQCPKCGTRFYDLGNVDPITCINCQHTFYPETILKPRRPVAEAVPEEKPRKPERSKKEDDESLDDEDSDSDMDSLLDVDEDEDDIDVEVDVEKDDDEDK